MSLYALSLLTDRQLIIDIDNPCDFEQIYLPNLVNWRPNQLLNVKKPKRIYFNCHNWPTCVKKFNPNHSDASSIFSNDIIVITGPNYDWLEYFASNAHFRNVTQKLGITDFRLAKVFRDWFDQLFKLSDSLQAKYALVLNQARLTNQTRVFCAQIRIGGKLANGRKDKVINDANSTRLFWRFIRDNFVAEQRNVDWRVFVTSDSESVENEAIVEFGRERVIRITGLNSHIDKQDTAKYSDCSRIEKPMLDFHFMRHCHNAVVSNSGFGILGAWSREKPIIGKAFVFYRGRFKPLTDNTMPFG